MRDRRKKARQTFDDHASGSARLRPRGRLGLLTIALLIAPVLGAQEPGQAEGTMIINGESVEIKHAYVEAQENPLEEGEQAFLVTVTAEPVPYLELDSYHGTNLQVVFGSDGASISRNLFVLTDTLQTSIGGLDIDAELSSAGPEEFRGRMSGSGEFFDDSYEIDLRFAARIPRPEELGEPLPAGGGAPGKAYVESVELLATGDLELIRSKMPAEKLQELDELRQDLELSDADVLEFLTMFQHTDLEVLGGLVAGDTTYLDVEGKSEGEPATGRIKMKLAEGRWVLKSESWH